jgi:biopolymer transport protein TolR
MAMTLGGTGERKAEINVTPLIDVLLVLLIIFMVISPVQSEGFKALAPQPALPGADATPQPMDIVITVAANGTLEINQEAVEMENLPARLKRIFEVRGNTVLFLRGAKELDFENIARVIEAAHSAGLDRVALTAVQ